MNIDKKDILEKICYTELVYGRIRKKLSIKLSNVEIEKFIYKTILATPIESFQKIGKNYYIENKGKGIKITINSYTTRVITVDSLK